MVVSSRDTPQLRPDLVVRRIPGPDEISYVVKDPVTRKYIRLPEMAGALLPLLDGKTSLAVLQQRLVASGAAAPSLGALEEFVQQLRAMDLLELPPAARMEHQLERLRRERGLRVRSRNLFGSLLHARFSVWDPDRWMDRVVPRIRFFWTPLFLAVSFCAILAATGIIAAHWERFGGALHGLVSGQAGIGPYVTFMLISLVVIAIHELGHGLTCKYFGGHVHEIGFLLMYFMPCFYCNVNDAWLFARRRERLWVTIAGGYIELFVGALATFVWLLTAPGHPVNLIAFQTALVASVSSVAVNLNPLIKLDGYYGLSDYLGIPNLREHAFRYVRALVQRHLFARPVPVPELSSRRRRIFLAYGVLAGAYSIGLLTLFAGRAFTYLVTSGGDWGLMAFLALAFWLIGVPAWRKGRELKVTSGKLKVGTDGTGSYRTFHLSLSTCYFQLASHIRRSPRRWLLAALVLLLAILPRWSMPVRLRCVFEPARQVVLYAPEEARVLAVLCAEGERVAVGAPLVRLQATGLRTEVARARLQLAMSRLREREAQAREDLSVWQSERRTAAAQQQELDRLEKRAVLLTVPAPLAGVCLTPRTQELIGRAVSRGDPLLRVGETAQLLAVARVDPAATGDLRPGAAALVMPHALPGTVLRGRVRELLPSENQATSGFRVTIPVANPGPVRPGMSGSVKVYGPRRSLLGHLREAVLRLVRADLWG
jgi:multidrug efflux pump subunit AcrA (membrane-fusion protein)